MSDEKQEQQQAKPKRERPAKREEQQQAKPKREAAPTTTPGVTPGQLAFGAYNEAKGGLTHDGKPIPPWSEVGDEVRAAWEAAAGAVLAVALPAPPSGPRWLGWLVRIADGGDVTRRPVSLPESVLEQYATGPASSPDLRRTVAQRIAADVSSDQFFDRLVRGRDGA